MIDIIFYLIENISSNGTATQSSEYFWKDKQLFLTADLAITGGPTHHFKSDSCATTLYKPIQYVAWWMLTFPVDTVYITTVKIYYRNDSKSNFTFVYILS
jgi:hypothetical protein